MKKIIIFALSILFLPLCLPATASAQTEPDSIVIAVGQDVPSDSEIPDGYRFPEEYKDQAIQFVTQDGVELCGYVLGEGPRGVAMAHANGWMLKSCLPFAERLAAEGYQVILWEFRNTYPSGDAPAGAEQRWDLDVLAAVQVLRERGVEEIFCMGASYGGSATAAAAPEIPELTGVAILSSPANVSGVDPVAALGKVTVPAFFAVSTEDFQGAPGVYQSEVETLYDACASGQKEIHILEGVAHGTDLITVPPEGALGYATIPATDEALRARNELAGQLLEFIGNCFSPEPPAEAQPDVSAPVDENGNKPAETPPSQSADESQVQAEPTSPAPDKDAQSAARSPAWYILPALALIILLAFAAKRSKRK